MINFLIVIAATVLGVLGDVFIKLAGERTHPQYGWLALGTVAYVLTVPCWFFAMRNAPLSVIGGFYAVSTVLLLAVIGLIFFHEHLRAVEILGLVMAFLAVMAFHRLL